jgi:hypothetical protein
MMTGADSEGSDSGATRQHAARARVPAAANDNLPDTALLAYSSSICRGEDASPTANAADSGSFGAARKLRPTDLFDDLTDADGALRAPIPLCATRGRVRPDK